MLNKDSRLLLLFLLYDIVLISCAFVLSAYIKFDGFDWRGYYVVLPIIVISWVGVVVIFSDENFQFRNTFSQRLKGEFLEFLLFTGIVSFALLALDLKLYSRLMVFGTILGFFFMRNLGYLILYQYLRMKRRKGKHVTNVLILGAGRIGGELLKNVNSARSFGYKIVGFLDDNPNNTSIHDELVKGGLDDLSGILKSTKVDELIIALPFHEEQKIQKALELADFHGLRTRAVPDYYRLFERSFRASSFGTLPIINVRQIPLDNIFSSALKRVFDVVFSMLVLIPVIPLLFILAVVIKIDSRGPVFYRPVRVGKGGKQFVCLKLRTMFENEDSADSAKSTVAGDVRITAVGKKLRRYNLDELPQFINVIKSEMSVVGPRPHRTFLNRDMQTKVEGYMLRHYIKPGITGWAQVNGWRGPTSTVEQKLQRTNHDLWYIENWSFWLDLEIVFKTVFGKDTSKNAF